MTRQPTSKRLALLAVGLAGALGTSPALAQSTQADSAGLAPDPGIEWAPCAEDETAECGSLKVPVGWDKRQGETIDLSLTRRPAQNPDERIGSLVYLAGGPGDPGALVVLHGDPGQLFSEDLLERFDLVGFDPRGTGNSHPVRCDKRLLDAEPDSYLTSQQEFDERVAYNERVRADCRERTGALFEHIDTLSVVHDLDAIRAALGETRLTAFGFSYGTAIGQQYAEEYPERVRALALDGNVDHSADTTRWVELKAEQVQGPFDAFVSWCESDGRCALNGRDVRSVWHDLLDRADSGEFPGLGSPDLVQSAYNCSFGQAWSELAGFLDALDVGGSTPDLPCPSRELPDEQHNRGLNIANFCADYHLPVSDYRQWKSLVTRAGNQYAPDMRFSPNGVDRIADCLGQDGDIPNPQHELDVTGSAPLLLVNPLTDPITGHNQAVNVNEQLGEHSVLLTYEGGGHTAYISGSDCVTGIVDAYLVDTEVPPDGTRCPALSDHT